MSDLFKFCKKAVTCIEKIVVRFHRRHEQIRKLNMNYELMRCFISKETRLDGHKQNVIAGVPGNNSFFHVLATTLENAFHTKRFSAATIYTELSRNRHSFPSIASLQDNQADENQHAWFGSESIIINPSVFSCMC